MKKTRPTTAGVVLPWWLLRRGSEELRPHSALYFTCSQFAGNEYDLETRFFVLAEKRSISQGAILGGDFCGKFHTSQARDCLGNKLVKSSFPARPIVLGIYAQHD